MTFDTAAAIDAYVDSLHTNREPDGYWHPSSLSGCLRQAVYDFRGSPESNPRDKRSQRILRVGHIFHEFVQQAIHNIPSVQTFHSEVGFVHEGLLLRGSADGLIQYDSGAWEVLEFKTINSNAFRYGNLPKPPHVIQVTAYLKALREVGGTTDEGTRIPPVQDALSQARIGYISKDDLRIEEYPVFWSRANEDELVRRLAVVRSHESAGTLPDRLPLVLDKKTGKPKRDYLCGYCPFQDACWEREDIGEW